jgi:hypothetical protein
MKQVNGEFVFEGVSRKGSSESSKGVTGKKKCKRQTTVKERL